MSEIQKNFVTPDLKTTLTCPECLKQRRINVSKFMLLEAQAKLKCKCRCGHLFAVVLERRRSNRKIVSFPGWMRHKMKRYKIMVKNISKQGMRIHLLGEKFLEPGIKVNVEFTLDDPMKSHITKDVRVKEMLGSTDLGCEFLTFNHPGNLEEYFSLNF